MDRVTIRRNDGSLTVAFAEPPRRVLSTCLLAALLMSSVSALGIMAIVRGSLHASGATDDFIFSKPFENHFGLLWICAMVTMSICVPIYAIKRIRNSVVWTFNRETGDVTCNGKHVTRLARIESVILVDTWDPDQRLLSHLKLLHDDGFQTEMDVAYEKQETASTAKVISDYTGALISHADQGQSQSKVRPRIGLPTI